MNNSFKHFISIVLVPLIGISILFTYAFLYVKDEIDFVQHEINGLKKISKIQNIVFDIQKLRGLSNIVNNDKNSLKTIKNLNDSIKQKAIKFKQKLKHLKKGTHLKKEFYQLLDDIIKHTGHKNDFTHLTEIIHNSRLLIENISYHSNIALDSNLKSHLLSQTIVTTLPKLIEYNGQIRGISSSIKNNKLTLEQKTKIITLQSKINDEINQLKFTMQELTDIGDVDMIKTIYNNTIDIQTALLDFVTDELILKDTIMLNSHDIFIRESNNIEFIVLLYETNHKNLKKLLDDHLNDKNTILLWVIFSSIASILFILFVNLLFYNRNKKYIEEIKTLSLTDSMTTLFNRRHFDNEFIKQLKIKKREKNNLSFIIIDIDHFKQYNDIYGHQAGDDTLIKVAKSLKSNLHRPSDMAFRLGGEEFGILCSNMDEEKSFDFANKLRDDIEKLLISHKGNSASEFITISIGLIVIDPSLNSKVTNLYKCADEALYNAKQNGRNRVDIYTF